MCPWMLMFPVTLDNLLSIVINFYLINSLNYFESDLNDIL